jgi:hypothetical protein
MFVQPVYLNIPAIIERGLASGTLTRNAAGVVRATALHPDRAAGSIFGHLREVNVPTQAAQPSAFVPAVATVALQAATLAYMKVRFDKIEAKLDAIHDQGAQLLSAVTQVKALQYLEFARPAAEALELLQRYGHGRRDRLLEDAHSRFIQATGGLRQLLTAHSSDQLLENARHVERLFQVASLCAAGEGQCLAFLEATAEERTRSLADHESLWSAVDRKLAEHVPTSRRFPTVDMLRASPEANPNRTRDRWQVETREAALALQGEQAVLTGLKALPTAEVEAWSEGANREEPRGLFVVVAA